jgi:hypothetical protein
MTQQPPPNHTPTPWTTSPGKNNTIAVVARRWETPLVASVSTKGRSSEEADANADRIAVCVNALECVPTADLELIHAQHPDANAARLRTLAAHLERIADDLQPPCPHCQDRPGYNGLGKTCKTCKGTGYATTP